MKEEDNAFGIELLRALLQDQDVDVLHIMVLPTDEPILYAIAPEIQRYLQSYVYVPYEQLPLQECFKYTLKQERMNIEGIRISISGKELDLINSKASSLR